MKYGLIDTAWGHFGYVARGCRLVTTFLPRRGRLIERAIRTQFPGVGRERRLLSSFCRDVSAYFAGEPVGFSVEVDLGDLSPFRQSVLEACRQIPYGKTASYGDVARAAGAPGAARAVGGTMANNPLPLVIPCHRVLCSDGSIGGFSSPDGVKQKMRLLLLEEQSFDPAGATHGKPRSRTPIQTCNRKRNNMCVRTR